MNYKKLLWCVAVLNISGEMYATQLVYSTKIRRVFALGASEDTVHNNGEEPHWIASAVPVVYTRERHIVQPELGVNVNEETIIGGALLNLRFRPDKHWWGEVTTGVEKEHMVMSGTSNFDICRKGFDDFVFSFGYNMFPDPCEKIQLVAYGLLGVPSRRKVTAQEFTNTLVGTRFWGLGFGGEASYNFVNETARSSFALAQIRFIHFFDRKWFPILPCDYTLKPGNTTDILLTIHHREKRNILEVGYNPTIFTNQGVITNTGENQNTDWAVRNSMYVSVAHICKNEDNPKEPIILGTGISFAWNQLFDTKIFSWWLSVTKVF